MNSRNITKRLSLLAFLIGVAGLVLPIHALQAANSKTSYLLDAENYHHYFHTFHEQELKATTKAFRDLEVKTTGRDQENIWPWALANIPLFESSNADFQQIYYFRWYAFEKHIDHTPIGQIINEGIVPVTWAGYSNSVVTSSGNHLHEARWLRDRSIADEDARFWLSAEAKNNRNYSAALADSIYSVRLATGDNKLTSDLFLALVENDRQWQLKSRDSNGFYYSIDTRDGMEVSISGSGYRPTLNSYMAADAATLEKIATEAGDTAAAAKFHIEAIKRRDQLQQLWNPSDNFYEVKTPRGDDPHFAGVRELIGYIPWFFNLAPPSRAIAWMQVKDHRGFAGGPFGPPTAERRSPRWRYDDPDQCQWNGPMWGFATTQTLIGMANMMDSQRQTFVSKQDYLNVFAGYVHSHRLTLPSGEVIPWLDESLDPDTGEWITRRILAERKSPLVGRGAYYLHSGFIDPLVTGLIGLRPTKDNIITLEPLLPNGAWNYFAVDGLPYHGHILTIFYDKTGQRYHKGAGFTLMVDGVKRATRKDLGPLTYILHVTKS